MYKRQPKHISFKMGGIATGVIGVVMMPWKLMADPRGYIFQWLLGYSGGLGSIAGVLVCDYWFVRKRRLELADLYLSLIHISASSPAKTASTDVAVLLSAMLK